MRATIDFDGAKVTTNTRERYVVVRRFSASPPVASIAYRTSDVGKARKRLVKERVGVDGRMMDRYAFTIFDTFEKRWIPAGFDPSAPGAWQT